MSWPPDPFDRRRLAARPLAAALAAAIAAAWWAIASWIGCSPGPPGRLP